MPSWFSVAVSAVAGLISLLTMLVVTLIGWFVRYVLANTDRRLIQLEQKTESHAKHVASQETQTAQEREAITALRSDVGDMRKKFDELASKLIELTAFLKQRSTPPGGTERPRIPRP